MITWVKMRQLIDMADSDRIVDFWVLGGRKTHMLDKECT